ncbi:MAG TPA: organomercurial lyase, partial [Pilimelia sp.]|nr:organomercurial lyase [Pilimelia sp.]
MNVDLLLAPDCPHADAARAVLDECLDRLGLQVRVRERVGDYPSPTILVDGVDVMTDAAGMPPVRACRLDVPSRSRVLAALRARATAGRHDVIGKSRDRPRPLLGPISARVRELSPPARALHRTILNAFAATGQPPDPASLPAPGGHDHQVLLQELHDRDAVRLDAYGGIRAAYPFSGTPTAHTVAIAGGSTVWAMCAIDALGIAAMLGRDVTITSRDPYTGEPVRVSI